MAFNQATAITRLGLTTPTADELAMIDSALLTSIQLAETFCDRGLAFRTDHVENHLCQHSNTLSSWLYPIASITSVDTNDSSAVPDYETDETNGVLFFKNSVYKLRLTTTITGGYQLDGGGPPDLELALWAIFNAVWETLQAGGATASGDVRKLSITGVGTVDYGAASTGEASSSGIIPSTAVLILDAYRRETA